MAKYTIENLDIFGRLIRDWSELRETDPGSLPTDIDEFKQECSTAGVGLNLPSGSAVTKVVFVDPAGENEIRVVLSHTKDLDNPLPAGPDGGYPLARYYDSAYKYDDREKLDDMTPQNKDTFRAMRIGEYSSSKCF